MASETRRLNGLLDAIAEAAVVAHVQSEQDLAWRDEALKEMAAARDEIRSMIARLSRELEEARERVLGVRSAVIRAAAALVRLAPRLDPREEAEWVRREPVVEIAMRLKDEVLALSTPQEVGE